MSTESRNDKITKQGVRDLNDPKPKKHVRREVPAGAYKGVDCRHKNSYPISNGQFRRCMDCGDSF